MLFNFTLEIVPFVVGKAVPGIQPTSQKKVQNNYKKYEISDNYNNNHTPKGQYFLHLIT